MKQYPYNIKVGFAGETVTLSNSKDSQTTENGIQIWGRMRGFCEFQPLVTLPDSIFSSQYAGKKPYIIAVDWRPE
jgi:hypothetical protein